MSRYEPPILLHEQEGLRIVKNQGNQFCIVTLFYNADPSKRSPEWFREASAGLTPEQAAREILIDYTAVMGAKVFPEITTNRHNIVVAERLPDFGRTVKYWGGFDYGLRNPSSFHIYTIVDSICYSVWELYEPCPNIPVFVEKMKACPYFPYIRYIAADPSLWYPSQQESTGNPVSIYDKFWRAGIRNMIKGINHQEDTWITMMRQHWATDDPTFRIFANCPNQIREFETAIYVNQSERQLMTTSFKEAINDKDNHALDDCKYFMLSQPKSGAIDTNWRDPEMVKKWALPSQFGTKGQNPLTSNPIPSNTKPRYDYGRGDTIHGKL